MGRGCKWGRHWVYLVSGIICISRIHLAWPSPAWPVQRTFHVQRQRKWQRQTERKMATTMAHRKWLLTPVARQPPSGPYAAIPKPNPNARASKSLTHHPSQPPFWPHQKFQIRFKFNMCIYPGRRIAVSPLIASGVRFTPWRSFMGLKYV